MDVDFHKKKKVFLIATVISSTALLGVMLYLNMSLNKFKGLAGFVDGLNVCYSRVNQTYTSHVLGYSSGEYLSGDFTSDTENCLSELVGYFEENVKSFIPAIAIAVNDLVDQVHQMNDGFGKKQSSFSSSSAGGTFIGHRFKKIETARFKIDEGVENFKQKTTSFAELANIIFYSLTGMFILFIGLAFKGEYTRFRKNIEIESSALEGLKEGDFFSHEKAFAIINQGLAANKLPQLTRLYEKFFSNDRVEEVGVSENKVDESVKHQVAFARGNETDSEIIEQIWNKEDEPQFVAEEELAPEEPPRFFVEEILSRSVDKLSSKFFTRGVTINLNLDSTVSVEESLIEGTEQIIYNMLDFALENPPKEKELSIDLQEDDEFFIFSVREEFVSPMESDNDNSNDSIALSICREIGKTIGGAINSNPMISSDGKQVGRITRYEAPYTQSESSKGLVKLEKGKKKEIVSKIRRQAEVTA